MGTMTEPLRIQQIRQFVITATTGSFRAAATGTFRSQAAVSAAMRDLERQIGGKLFEQGRRAKLTPLAQTLFPIFQNLLTAHDQTVSDVRQLAQAERGSISLGVAPFLTEEWLAKMLIEFSKKNPDVRISVTVELSHHMRNLVANGSVDIGIAGRLNDDPKLAFWPVADDPFGILCESSHQLALSKRAVPWSVLRSEKLIANAIFEMLKGKGLGDQFENPSMTVACRTSIFACIRAGIGLTVLPKFTCPSNMEGLAFVPLARPQIIRTVGIMTRQGQTLLPAATAMQEWIFHSLSEYLHSRGSKIISTDTKH